MPAPTLSVLSGEADDYSGSELKGAEVYVDERALADVLLKNHKAEACIGKTPFVKEFL